MLQKVSEVLVSWEQLQMVLKWLAATGSATFSESRPVQLAWSTRL
jgi:hypothetical protein